MTGHYVLERCGAATALRYVGEGPLRGMVRHRDSKKCPDVVTEMSPRSASRMRMRMAGLPVEMLGDRPLFIALTCPARWRPWVPDACTWEAKRQQMLKRWERKWGRLVGVWKREFQESGSPHMHWYVPTPDAVSDREYQGLLRRTLLGRDLLHELGTGEARAAMPTIGIQKRGRWAGHDFGGPFAMWLRRNWSEVVTGGTSSGGGRAVTDHYARGVDVQTCFWSDGVARSTDKHAVLAYMAGEMGKSRQTRIPYGFGPMTHFYGFFGRDLGFTPQTELQPLDDELGRAVADEMERWVRARVVRRNDAETAAQIMARRDRRRDWHGVEALGLYGHELDDLLERAREHVHLARADIEGHL